MAQSPLNALSEAERALAFERFELLRPALEGGVQLARVARDRGIALRTAQHWARQYRRDGLAGLVRRGRSDRGKRHLSDTLRQATYSKTRVSIQGLKSVSKCGGEGFFSSQGWP
jgi:putative transposase